MKFIFFLLPLVSGFSFPFLGGKTVELKRNSVLDLKGFVPLRKEEDLSFVRYGRPENKSTVVFISGLEFSSLSLAQFAKYMKTDFNLMYVCSNTQYSVPKLDTVLEFIEDYIEDKDINNVTLVGESSGGVLALNAGLRKKLSSRLNGIVLLNSATAYFGSPMNRFVDVCRNVNIIEYNVGILLFLMMQKYELSTMDYDNFHLMTLMLINLFTFPRSTLLKRIDEWIIKGLISEGDLKSYPHKVVLVASGKDEMFSSYSEAEKLHSLIPNSTIVHVPTCGHLITPEKFSLTKTIKTFI